jgi:murein DD-endopeptidase
MTTTIPFNAYNPGPAFGVSDLWGMRKNHPVYGGPEMHRGLDFAAAQGTPIPAAADGVVFSIQDIDGYGHCVVIKHTPLDGSPVFYTMYAHLDQVPTL